MSSNPHFLPKLIESMSDSFEGSIKLKLVSELEIEGVLFVEDGNHGEYRPLPHEFVDVGVPFVRPPNLINGRIDLDECQKINAEAFNRVRKGIGKGGDIVLTHNATIGRLAITKPSDPVFVTNPQTTVWRTMNEDVINAKYLYYFMRSSGFQEQLDAHKGRNATFDYVSLTKQRSLVIPVLAITTQRKIADTLSALDDRIALLRETNATLESIAQALFKSWFVDFDPVHANQQGIAPEGMSDATAALFPDGFEESELGLVPRGWINGAVGDIASIKGGKQLDKDAFDENGLNPVFGGAGVMGHSNRSNATGFVITVGRVGAYCGQFFWRIGDAWVNNNASNIQPNKARDAVWLYQWLRNVNMDIIKKGAAQPFVSNGDIAQLKMVTPPEETRSCFVEIAEPIYLKMHELQHQAQTLATLRDTLLPRLISGQLRLPEAEEILA
jgi:type I restriction enzyme S subunit